MLGLPAEYEWIPMVYGKKILIQHQADRLSQQGEPETRDALCFQPAPRWISVRSEVAIELVPTPRRSRLVATLLMHIFTARCFLGAHDMLDNGLRFEAARVAVMRST